MNKLNAKEIKNYHLNGNLYKLYGNAEMADVNFLFKDESKEIPANRCLLAVASPVFYKMFFGDLREPGDVTIVDATYSGFREFLQFFYCDKIELTVENIQEVMIMSDKYDIPQLMTICAIFLECKLTIETVCWIYEIALMFNLTHLINECRQKISLETISVLQTKSFEKCSVLILTKILEMNQLSCDEITVFRAVMKWATYQCLRNDMEPNGINKREQLGYCFDLIRFPTMTAENFTECISDDGLFNPNEFLDILSHLTLKRPLKTTVRYSKEPRNGIPAWIKDQLIRICDRRSQPNLNCLLHKDRDITVFTVNERILLGQFLFSTFKTSIGKSKDITRKSGRLVVRKVNVTDTSLENDFETELDDDDISSPALTTTLLEQKIEISSVQFTKILLDKPLIIQPFIDYEIETEWELEDDEMLLFRTHCRSEIMIDGGIRFQFKSRYELDYDNIGQGMLMKFYFKKW